MIQERKSSNDLGQFLVDHGYLDNDTLNLVLKVLPNKKISLLSYLGQEKYLTYYALSKAIADFFSLEWYDLHNFNLLDMPSDILTPELIREFFILPLHKTDEQVKLGICDPSIIDLNELNFIIGHPISLIAVEQDKLAKIIDDLYTLQLQEKLESKNKTLDDWPDELPVGTHAAINFDDIESMHAPAVIFINKILFDAIHKNVSDIHFEPYQKFYRIRYRIDGILHEINQPPQRVSPYLIPRLKILANIDISEHRLPQDGRFKLRYSPSQTIDFRLSTCPTFNGEKAVVRILESSRTLLAMHELGLEPEHLDIFKRALQQPQGMILVTGPTGSGKTTTLYTALDKLNTPRLNIVTVEDPIEISLFGINQVQVNIKTGLTFNKTLRAFLRQDPDIIMLGEIRDLETADTAIKAAQTGHLLLSTLHTNNAAETIIRLLNMGVSPLNIAGSIKLIIAQRLIRKLCIHCREKVIISKKRFSDNHSYFYEARSCENCHEGYKGRTAIFEILVISEEIRQLIAAKANHQKLLTQIEIQKNLSLAQSGLQQVKKGTTSFAELNRVLGTSFTSMAE